MTLWDALRSCGLFNLAVGDRFIINGYNGQLFNIFFPKIQLIMSIAPANNASKYILIGLIFNGHQIVRPNHNTAKQLILAAPLLLVALNYGLDHNAKMRLAKLSDELLNAK
jgi:hypothetical protein